MGALFRHRLLVLLLIPVAAGGLFAWASPIPQPAAYHDFADIRTFFGIANFSDVISNTAFLAGGLLGLVVCGVRRPAGALAGWTVFFAGVAAVSMGSAYYHSAPTDATLVWDRLPMAVGFTGAYVALLAEYVSARLERMLLIPVLLVGGASVAYWALTSDLAAYFAVQATVFASIAWMLAAFENGYRQKPYVLFAFAFYGAAIVFEQLDHRIFALTDGIVSGHTLKHLFAAMAPLLICRMLMRRAPSPSTAVEA